MSFNVTELKINIKERIHNLEETELTVWNFTFRQ
jgi:hypothetical protein